MNELPAPTICEEFSVACWVDFDPHAARNKTAQPAATARVPDGQKEFFNTLDLPIMCGWPYRQPKVGLGTTTQHFWLGGRKAEPDQHIQNYIVMR